MKQQANPRVLALVTKLRTRASHFPITAVAKALGRTARIARAVAKVEIAALKEESDGENQPTS